jgi:hypothetical protein
MCVYHLRASLRKARSTERASVILKGNSGSFRDVYPPKTMGAPPGATPI